MQMPISTGNIEHFPQAEGRSYISVACMGEFYCLHYTLAECKSLY